MAMIIPFPTKTDHRKAWDKQSATIASDRRQSPPVQGRVQGEGSNTPPHAPEIFLLKIIVKLSLETSHEQ